MPDNPQDEPQFAIDGCTCIPFTRQTDPPRYLSRPTDTVDMISGWERGRDCPHHAPAVSPPPDQTALRDRLAEAMAKRDGHPWPTEFEDDERDYYRRADAALGVLPPPADRAAVYREVSDRLAADAAQGAQEGWMRIYKRGAATKVRKWADELAAEAPLSPYYEHPECGFHWHGRDGMDIPMRDGQPVCPRCELRRLAAEAQQQEPPLAAHHAAVPAGAVCKCPGDCGHRPGAEAQQPDTETREATLSGRVAQLVADDARALRMDLYDDLATYARQTGNTGLQQAQIRDHLTEFLLEGLLRRAVAGDRLRCPRCRTDITDYAEDDHVFRTGDERPYCSSDCVIAAHRKGLPTAPAVPVPPAADGAGEEAGAPPVCEGFVWIGQSFATCERCGQPAWDHVGEEVPVEGSGPFDNQRTVRPWAPGQADRIRAKWSTSTKEA